LRSISARGRVIELMIKIVPRYEFVWYARLLGTLRHMSRLRYHNIAIERAVK